MYKVGQVVRLRSDLVSGEKYGLTMRDSMLKEDTIIIADVLCDATYHAKNGFIYHAEMLAEVVGFRLQVSVGDIIVIHDNNLIDIDGVRAVVVELSEDTFLVDYGRAYDDASADFFHLHSASGKLSRKTGMWVDYTATNVEVIKRV